ncbi:MAG: hypothetical protein DCC71_16010 [Proteobacteria bacterium]|nr:MAG: hypothetical protein DCC71_16010 [Pseudomonadota bacterium]
MAVACPGCGRAYADERFAFGRTFWCACGRRIGAEPVRDARPGGEPEPRFAVDAMLGRLARWLRVLGLDATWRAGVPDAELVRDAQDEARWILTRDRRLLDEWRVPRVHLVASEDPHEQLREIVEAFALRGRVRPFARCTRCNAPLEPLARERAAARVPPRVFAGNDRFWLCPRCDRVYWEGSHVERMRRTLADLLAPD